jgi:hypothetical protein
VRAKTTFSEVRAATIFLAFVLIGCAAQTPGVRQGDPAESFFRDQVTYPHKVRYADARSDDGTVWNIGYMDVTPLFTPNPKVLVLIHGRACSGAYFGHAIEMASKRGIRVIAPDLPNYGKSIPGNLDKPLVRSMQQTREVIHDLIVNQLKIVGAMGSAVQIVRSCEIFSLDIGPFRIDGTDCLGRIGQGSNGNRKGEKCDKQQLLKISPKHIVLPS